MKNRATLLILAATVAIAATVVTGCADKDMFKNIHVQPQTTLPLGSVVASDSALFALADIQKSMLVGADGVLTFVDSTQLSLSGEGVGASLVEVPLQQLNLSKSISGLPVVGGFVELPAGRVIDRLTLTVPGGAMIDTTIFQDGSFSVSVGGLIGIPGYDKAELLIVVHSLLKNGQPVLLAPDQVLALGPEYMLVPEAGNKIRVEFRGRVPAMATLDGVVNLNGGSTEYIAGFFGRKEISRVSRVLSAGKLSDFMQGAQYVRFDRPQIVFRLQNSYNAPMMAQIESLEFDGRTVLLKEGPQGKTIYIAPNTQTEIVIGNANTLSGSGLTEMLTKDFRRLSVELNTLLNPTAADLGDPSYVPATHNSMGTKDTLGGGFRIDLPLDGVMDRVTFDREVVVDLHALNKNELNYENLTLALSGTNTMPLEMEITLSVRMPGSGGLVPLFDEPVRFPSSVNNLRPNDPAFQAGVVNRANLIMRSLSADRIALLLAADKLYLHLSATTLGAKQMTATRIYSPSELNIQIVAGAKLDYVVNAK